MSNVGQTNATKGAFFPKKTGEEAVGKSRTKGSASSVRQNSTERKGELEKFAKNDADISIPSGIMEFAKIKNAVDKSPPIDNSDKIAKLKSEIEAGTYTIDYDALADKLLEQEF